MTTTKTRGTNDDDDDGDDDGEDKLELLKSGLFIA
jgi:hypothetical protein